MAAERRVVALLLASWTRSLDAQVPASADLWRVPAATAPLPSALEPGPTGTFWNPAQAADGRWVIGAQLIQTPDAVGLTAIVAGVNYRLSRTIRLVLLAGRADLGDLPRTTSSPTNEIGTIPVYEQLAGVGATLSAGGVRLGLLLRGHDARFDADHERGSTVDVGMRLRLGQRLTLAAASHFLPVDLTGRDYTDYYAAAQYSLNAPPVWGGRSQILVRYGASLRQGASGGLEHGVGLGWSVNDRFGVDARLTREVAYGGAAWRPSLGMRLRVGRYNVSAARASGLNDLGATYRVGLDLELRN